ncbi:MAG TPA: hypothetical protein VH475_07170 [Tepidisphaeraceae bacterium]
MRVARGALVALAFALAWTLIVAAIDRLLALPPWFRCLLLVVEAGGVAAILAGPLRDAIRRRVDWVEASEALERRNAALEQRLVTVTSQLLAPASYRGSPRMLDAIAGQVADNLAAQPRSSWADWRGVLRPAFAAVCLLVATAGLWGASWLDLPRLVARQARPFAGLPPVTTTQIDLTPAGATVREREPLVVKATVRHLGDGTMPTIFVRGTGDADWDASPMIPVSGDAAAYTFNLGAMEQDQRFYVKAGDATTPTYDLRVLRRPGVAEFRIRYTYPTYTGRAPLSLHNTDGLIEAPQGTQALVAVVATEPLASAWIRIGGGNGAQRVELAPTAEPNVRQGSIVVSKDQPCALEMTTDRGVVGRGPQSMKIRAVQDRPPLVRMIQPATDLRLSPRELLPVAWQALDDYGVAQIWVRAQVNANPPVEFPRRISGDPRRVESSSELDLARLNVKVGDVVSISIAATDKARQPGTSDVRHVLISPRSIDVTTHQRLAELSQAAGFARDWADQLARTRQTLQKAATVDDAHGQERAAAAARVSRMLAAAQETGVALRQSLLRAIVYSAAPAMSDALEQMVDATAAQLDRIDRVNGAIVARREGNPAAPAADPATVARLTRAVSAAGTLAAQVRQLGDGDQAAAVLADRINLRSSPATAPTDKAALERRRQTLERARQDVAAALAALHVDAKAKEAAIDAQLQQRIDAAARLVAAARPVDLDGPARRWSAAIRNREPQPPHIDERLLAMSQARSVRPDPALVAARDLQLAARAAAALSDLPDPSDDDAARRKALTQGLEQFPDALAALRAEHEVYRRALATPTPAEARKIHTDAAKVHTAAAAARAKMLAWAAGPDATPDELAARARELEDLALAANAATEARDFDQATEADRRLATASGHPELADAAAAPRRIDKLSQKQERLADQTASVADDTQAHAIAGAQRDVADQIGQTRLDPSSNSARPMPAEPSDTNAAAGPTADDLRQRATEAISQAQEKLASFPMQLMTAQQAAQTVAEVSSRLVAAQADAAEATPARRESAERVVGMVKSELDDARKAFGDAMAPLADRTADDLAESLRPFAPDTGAARGALGDSLKDSLANLRDVLTHSAETGDRAGVEPAAQGVRDAVAAAQDALRDAQNKVIERDPLVSARWFARAAADALDTAPPDKRAAVTHQKKTLEALSKAAVEALRRARTARLTQVPGFSSLYLPLQTPGAWSDDPGVPGRPLMTLPAPREWGRLRERLGTDPIDAPTGESEPPGYGDALRLYFEVLGRAENKPNDAKH